MEFFDVGETCIGEREPLQLILDFNHDCCLGLAQLTSVLTLRCSVDPCFLSQSPSVLFIVCPQLLPH